MISILMATYNGENYIKEQMDSLLTQTVQQFKIFIRDDCSQDRTFEILTEYQREYPEQIYITRNEKNSGSPKYNFFNLILEHKDDYIMLCDQDDVWNTDKIEITLAELRRMEKKFGVEKPILVHTDLTVVDSKLNIIAPSYKVMLDADYSRIQLNHLLSQNTLTGCTALFNCSLSNLIIEEPEFCVMHDWWLMLVASCFGVVSSLETQTILYRQHNNNSVGTVDVKSLNYQFHKMFRKKEIRDAIERTYPQARCFLNIYGEMLSKKQIETIQNYLSIPNLSKCKKIKMLVQGDFLKNTFARKIAHILFV